jgi:hypothetical protein
MAFLSRYWSSTDQTSSSPSSHSISTPRETASGNPYKNLSVIQRSYKMLWPFWADTQGCRPDILLTEQLPQRKQPLETTVKICARSNGQIKSYGHFESMLKVGDQTSLSLSDSMAYLMKTASGNPCKNLSAIQRSDHIYGPFQPILKVVDHTSFSLNNDSSATPTKTASGNPCKILRAIK